MSELLFQNTLITWIGSPLISVLVSFGVVICIWGVLYLMDKKKGYITPPIIRSYIPTHEDDPHYTEQTLAHIREYLQERAHPHHTTAHTAPEISEYLRDDELVTIIGELEHIEYSGGVLSTEEKEKYNERIEKLIKRDLVLPLVGFESATSTRRVIPKEGVRGGIDPESTPPSLP